MRLRARRIAVRVSWTHSEGMQTSLTHRVSRLDFWLSVVLAGFLFVLAARGLLAPAAAARGFGVAVEHPGDLFYILVKGDRDLSSALAVTVLLLAGERRALGLFVLVSTVQPVLDFWLSAHDSRGHVGYAFAIHMSAAFYGWFLGWRLLRRAPA